MRESKPSLRSREVKKERADIYRQKETETERKRQRCKERQRQRERENERLLDDREIANLLSASSRIVSQEFQLNYNPSPRLVFDTTTNKVEFKFRAEATVFFIRCLIKILRARVNARLEKSTLKLLSIFSDAIAVMIKLPGTLHIVLIKLSGSLHMRVWYPV